MTETSDDAQPPLIIYAATTPAPVVDRAVLEPLHAVLKARDLLPTRQLVDAAYIDANGLVEAMRDHCVDLVGSVPKDNQWQARLDGAFTIEAFPLDWYRQVAVCPTGHSGGSWCPDHNLVRTVVRIRFATREFKVCSLKPRGRRSERHLLTPRSREAQEALVAARAREGKPAFAADGGDEPAPRAHSRGVRAMGLRRSRYFGLAKTHLQHLLTAAAINLGRLVTWIDDAPAAHSRRSAFIRLMAQPISA